MTVEIVLSIVVGIIAIAIAVAIPRLIRAHSNLLIKKQGKIEIVVVAKEKNDAYVKLVSQISDLVKDEKKK